MNPVLAGLTVYILLQLAIGVWASRRIATEADYLVAGRRLGPVLATFSIFATWFGAETCIGSAGAIYTDGLSGGSGDPFGYALCLLLMGVVFAVPLWKRGLLTLGDLFRQRFSPGVERLAVILMVPTSLMWAAAQIRAFGQVLTVASGVELDVMIGAAAIVVIAYTVFGGLLADAVTDVVLGAVLLLGLAILLVAVLMAAPDVGAALSSIPAERLNPFHPGDRPLMEMVEAWAIPILGSVMAQELVARVIAARSPELARRATLAGTGIYFIAGLVPAVLGLMGASLLPGLSDPEQLLPRLAQQYLPTVLYVIFAGALVSAILSTVDSALLACGSLTAHNLVAPLLRAPSDRLKLKLARIAVVAFGLAAWVLALRADGVYALVEEASAFGSAGVVTVAAFGLFTRIGNTHSAIAALLLGMGVWLAGNHWLDLSTPYLWSLAAALGGYLVFSFAGREAAQAPT
jgi:SSS family transporter